MKVATNFNNEEKIFNTIKELEKFLNEALHYCDKVFLTVDFSDIYSYQEITKQTLRYLINESKFYKKPLNISQSWD